MTSLEEALRSLPVTRLAHFTPMMNVWPILRDGWVRSSAYLKTVAPEAFAATDPVRGDGHPDHICCTFEYPNVHYLRTATTKTPFKNYRDWAVLLIEPDVILSGHTLIAPCNAAKAGGAYLASGPEALVRCWSNPCAPSGRWRGPKHLPAAPTDMQAEVLVEGPIGLSQVQAIVVKEPAVAAEFYAVFEENNLHPGRLQWKVSPTMFDVDGLRRGIRDGGPIIETNWAPKGAT